MTHPVAPMSISRRDFLRAALLGAASLSLPAPLAALVGASGEEDLRRLRAWTRALRDGGLHRASVPLGAAAARVGELAVGTPYEAFTLEAYLKAGGSPPRSEPLTLSLTRFDCVTLVESSLAVARLAARSAAPAWEAFGREMERMRYRGGVRKGYASRLHYFSEWISDGEKRGLVRDLGEELGGVKDDRPLRFMSEHRKSYPALRDDETFRAIQEMEKRLDCCPRRVIPTSRIPEVADRIRTGDVLAFATDIEGLDVTHSAFAYRDKQGVLRVLHAPLSGGAVEVTRTTLPEYVEKIRKSSGILLARPLWR
jgi:hypothetical protein